MEIFHLKQNSSIYPSSLQKYLGRHAPTVITGLGNLDILNHKKLAFFCSVKCPGHLILKAYDLSQSLKHAGVTAIGGFHSPIERECLTILLRGKQPVIVCPARGIKGMRMRAGYRESLEEGRLLFLSPFKESQRRNTVETAIERNRFVAALADAVFVAHASPNSKMEKFCGEVLKLGKSLYSFESDANKCLFNIGAGVSGLVLIEVKVNSLNETKKEDYAGWVKYLASTEAFLDPEKAKCSGFYELARNWRIAWGMANDRPMALINLGPMNLFHDDRKASMQHYCESLRQDPMRRFVKVTWQEFLDAIPKKPEWFSQYIQDRIRS